MELRKNHSFMYQLRQLGERAIQPFMTATTCSNLVPFIMPLKQVEQVLTDHYVSQKPLAITFEYYDQQDLPQQRTIEGLVMCPIRLDRRIILTDLAHDFTFIIPVDHILRVSHQ